jgi:type IX secretion system PorP/SprF family membrane protein
VNPAFSGDIEGTWRFANIYRSQWYTVSKPFTTVAVSYDKILSNFNQSSGAGIIFLYDQSGIVGLTSVKLYASGSYRFILNNSHLRLGLQIGVVHKYFDFGSATFPLQFNILTGKYDLPPEYSGENPGEMMTYADANAGLLWKTKIRNFIPELGVTCQHLNMPVESFSGAGEHLAVRTLVHGGIRIETYRNFSILPLGYLSYQAHTNELLAGILFNFGMVSEHYRTTAFSPGVFLRNGINRNYDALVIFTGINFVKMKIGLSYDITLSELQSLNKNQGAFEISLIYSNAGYFFNINTLPCERY